MATPDVDEDEDEVAAEPVEVHLGPEPARPSASAVFAAADDALSRAAAANCFRFFLLALLATTRDDEDIVKGAEHPDAAPGPPNIRAAAAAAGVLCLENTCERSVGSHGVCGTLAKTPPRLPKPRRAFFRESIAERRAIAKGEVPSLNWLSEN